MIYGHQFCLFMQIAKRGEDEAKMNEATSRGGGRVGVGRGGGCTTETRGQILWCAKMQSKANKQNPKEDRCSMNSIHIQDPHTSSTDADAEGQSEVSAVASIN